MSSRAISRAFSQMFLVKPRKVVIAEQQHEILERTLTLPDLLAIGIGGTVGSGVFVLTGLIAHEYAGPGVVWSWVIAGFGCAFSALSYAEMASRVPSAGSSYAYVYTTLGELPAVIAGWCLTLEYGLSGAAVARSWGEKVVSWADSIGMEIWAPLDPGVGVNIFAALLQAATVVLLLGGVNIGKNVVNFFTVLKMVLVLFMIIGGLSLFRASNVSNWAPMGFSGILRGSTSAFFGYLGYDEVCCLAAEAKNPQDTLPKAVFGTIGTVTVLYSLAALALAGMMNYEDIDENSGFSEAFKDRGWTWAQQLVAVGEIVTLPLVVLISFIAQPRLQFALSQDGLLPKFFGQVDSSGNLRNSIIVSGIILTVVALFVPFTYLDGMISAGVLLSFNLTNSALIVTHRHSDLVPLAAQDGKNTLLENDMRIPTRRFSCKAILFLYNLIAFVSSFLLVYCDLSSAVVAVPVFLSLVLVYLAYYISLYPENEDPHKSEQYRVPYMPYPPLIGIYVNYFLVAQLEWWGITMIFGYFGLATVVYFIYGVKHSVGNSTGWSELLGESHVSDRDDFDYTSEAVTGLMSEEREGGHVEPEDSRRSRHSTQSVGLESHIRVRLSSHASDH